MDAFIGALASAQSVFVLTGAGMSAESGLPTFRGAGGYWENHRFEDLASPEGFARDPVTVWRWYSERIRAYRGAQPNAGHLALAKLENLVPRFTLATQNVDSLHWRAGSENVLELHGDLRAARCTRCAGTYPLDDGMPEERIACGCGGRFRPQVVWFGEALPHRVWQSASRAASQADVIIVVGTSAQVYPAAALALANARAYVVEINPDASAISDRCDLVIREGAAATLNAVVRQLYQDRGSS